MQTIVKLPLKSPLELSMVKVPGMKFEQIGVHRDGRILEIYDDLDPSAFGSGGEIQQRVFVQLQLGQDTFQARVWIIGHRTILTGVQNICVGEKSRRGFLKPVARFQFLVLSYSYLRASMGSSFAALMAGSMPLTMPTKLRMPVDQTRVAASIFK